MSYFELPQLQKAIGKYQQLVNQDMVTLDTADSLIKTIDAHLASINAGLISELS